MPLESTEAHRPPPPCRTQADCEAKGLAALRASRPDARSLLTLACDKGSRLGCLELGKAYVLKRVGKADREAAKALFKHHCRDPTTTYGTYDCAAQPDELAAERCMVDACAWLVSITPPDDPKNLTYAERACTVEGKPSGEDAQKRGEACLVLARHHQAGERPAPARHAYTEACSLGVNDACNVTLGARPSHSGGAPGPDAPTMMTLESLDSDGLVLRDISCALEGSTLLNIVGGITVGAGFSERRVALERCAPNGYQAKLNWTAHELRVDTITASTEDPAVAACVERTLRGATSVVTGTCTATVVVGGTP